MIIRTCLQCLKVVEHQKLYVATDNKKIQSCVKNIIFNQSLHLKTVKQEQIESQKWQIK